MLKKRIIPIVLIDGFSVIKTINFSKRRNLGSPITVLNTYNSRNVDELVILDIDATKQGREIDKFVISEIAQNCFMPLTVGGGIKSIKTIETLLRIGADKIVLNSALFSDPKFVETAVMEFGSQCIVASIDITTREGNYFVFNHEDPNETINFKEMEGMISNSGVGELLITSIDLDGTMAGGDCMMAKFINSRTSMPVIYAGGVSSPQDTVNIFKKSSVSAVGVSSLFHFTNTTPKDCRNAMREYGFPVRAG